MWYINATCFYIRYSPPLRGMLPLSGLRPVSQGRVQLTLHKGDETSLPSYEGDRRRKTHTLTVRFCTYVQPTLTCRKGVEGLLS